MDFYSLIKNIRWRLGKIIYNKNQQNWQQAMFYNEDFRKGRMFPLEEYSLEAPIKSVDKRRVVCIYDGKIKNGGLADRLRGIISVYEICKEFGLYFYIIFNSPFKLEEFLEPNDFDWRIPKEELNYNTRITYTCHIDTINNSNYEAQKQKEWFRDIFNEGYQEYHIRTNAFFSYKGSYSKLFHELFRPSARLQTSINREKEILSTGYISASFRFMNLLGDFNETTGINIGLPNKEKEELTEKSISQLQILHQQIPDRKILVNSDSSTFLEHANIFEFVHIVPGNITHIDAKNENEDYKIYEKTFLDFFMIANAEKIYLFRTGQMYNSGFPYAASLIYNKPFETIEF